MKRIYKYALDLQDTITVRAPRVLRWLHCDVQHGHPVLWGEVDIETQEREHVLVLRGTGHDMTGEEGRHIGTIMLQGGALVFHLFEAKEGS